MRHKGEEVVTGVKEYVFLNAFLLVCISYEFINWIVCLLRYKLVLDLLIFSINSWQFLHAHLEIKRAMSRRLDYFLGVVVIYRRSQVTLHDFISYWVSYKPSFRIESCFYAEFLLILSVSPTAPSFCSPSERESQACQSSSWASPVTASLNAVRARFG